MTATQRFIEKAIEGGWDESRADVVVHDNAYWASYEKALLDPEAWKAVGKVEGWRDDEHESTHSFRDRPGSLTRLLYGWEYRWHEMLHALEDGKSIEKYLATIV